MTLPSLAPLQLTVRSDMDETNRSSIDYTCGSARLDLVPEKDEPSAPPPLYSELPHMIAACAIGDADKFQGLLHDAIASDSESHTADLVRYLSGQMLTQAIQNKQSAMVELLLLKYPAWRICDAWYLRTAFENPHYQTFRLLHAHDPQVINYEFESDNSTSLMQACIGGVPLIPNYLIDQGAWLNEGGFPGCGTLWMAVSQGQPLTLIRRMIDSGARVTGATLMAATDRQDLEILGEILARGNLNDWQFYIKRAKKQNNADVIRMVEQRAKRKKSCWSKREHKPASSTMKKAESQIRWWHFHR